jgi:hypothetical protein
VRHRPAFARRAVDGRDRRHHWPAAQATGPARVVVELCQTPGGSPRAGPGQIGLVQSSTSRC